MAILREYMTSNLEFAQSSDDLIALAKKMAKEDVGFLPVVDNDKYVGVVTDRDVTVKGLAQGSAEGVKAADIMTENVVTGHPNMEVDEAKSLMQENQIKRLLVVDQERVSGVVTLGDLGVKNADQVAGDIVSKIAQGSANN